MQQLQAALLEDALLREKLNKYVNDNVPIVFLKYFDIIFKSENRFQVKKQGFWDISYDFVNVPFQTLGFIDQKKLMKKYLAYYFLHNCTLVCIKSSPGQEPIFLNTYTPPSINIIDVMQF